MRDAKTLDISDVPANRFNVAIFDNRELQIGCNAGNYDETQIYSFLYICATPEQLRAISGKCIELAGILDKKNQSKEAPAA